MIVRVKCFTGMRRYAPQGQSEFALTLEAGARTAELLDQLSVPADAGVLIAVNGTCAHKDQLLQDGDTIVLFTPVEGG